MAQGNNKKKLTKLIRKGNKGYPIATIAFYGPTNLTASKLVCAVIAYDGADAEPIKKWFANSDVRKSEKTMNEVLAFIEAHTVKSVSMVDGIIGCPHEEGIDYPNGDSCPQCDYWKGRDRFTQSLIQ
jgi:hypothetical protein